MKIKMFGLLYLKEGERSIVNLKIKDFQDQISVYVNNALSLSRSLQMRGIPFTLLTNDKSLVDEYIPSDNGSLNVREIPFTTIVPTGISFYSQHFKFDVFRYLATLQDCYVAYCDVDMLCINDAPKCLQNIVNANIPLCYDISDLIIPGYGQDNDLQDMNVLHGFDGEGRRFGGEFISGPPEFFKALINEIDGLFKNYIGNLSNMHHIGNETLTSAAIEKLRRQGVYIADAGTIGIIGRYTFYSILSPQKPFEYFEHCFLLHLPGDKRFLAGLARRGMVDKPEFLKLYGRHRNSFIRISRRMGRRLLHLLRNLAHKKPEEVK